MIASPIGVVLIQIEKLLAEDEAFVRRAYHQSLVEGLYDQDKGDLIETISELYQCGTNGIENTPIEKLKVEIAEHVHGSLDNDEDTPIEVMINEWFDAYRE